MFAAQQTLAFFPTYVWVFDLPADEARHLNETILGPSRPGARPYPDKKGITSRPRPTCKTGKNSRSSANPL